MKKSKILFIKFRSLKDMDLEFKNKLKLLSQNKLIKDQETPQTIYFDSIKTYKNCLNANRIEIIAAIKAFKPKSIYELAKIVSRDRKDVTEDCDRLALSGFIILEQGKTKEKKTDNVERVKPVLSFDYSQIVVIYPPELDGIMIATTLPEPKPKAA